MLLRSKTVKLSDARSRFPRVSRWLSVGLVVSGVAGIAAVAGAQPGSPPPAARPGVDAQIGFERPVNLSPQEMVRSANGYLAQMNATAGTTQRQLAQARAQRDVVKTLCLNDKLSEVDVATRSAADRLKTLQAAVAANNTELANHEFTILTVLQKRAAQLSAEANQCIGEEAAFTGATNVTTTVDPGLPVTDPTTPPDFTLVLAPPCLECFPNAPPPSGSSNQ